MIRLLVITSFLFAVLATTVMPVHAYDAYKGLCNDPTARNSTVCKEKTTQNPLTGDDGVLIKIANIVAYFAGAIAVIMIIVAGIRFITANGDSGNISSARNTIIAALIGLAIIILARTIINYVVIRV